MVHQADLPKIPHMAKKTDLADKLEFAARMRLTIEALGFPTRVDFARSIGETKGVVYHWCVGTAFPSYEPMMKLYRIHGVDPNWLFLGKQSGLPAELVTKIQHARAKRDSKRDTEALT